MKTLTITMTMMKATVMMTMIDDDGDHGDDQIRRLLEERHSSFVRACKLDNEQKAEASRQVPAATSHAASEPEHKLHASMATKPPQLWSPTNNST